jgi:hypothetical protein
LPAPYEVFFAEAAIGTVRFTISGITVRTNTAGDTFNKKIISAYAVSAVRCSLKDPSIPTYTLILGIGGDEVGIVVGCACEASGGPFWKDPAYSIIAEASHKFPTPYVIILTFTTTSPIDITSHIGSLFAVQAGPVNKSPRS